MSILITKHLVISCLYFSYMCCIIKEKGENMKVDYKIIGARIKEQRKKYGITQEVLAEMLEVSIGYVSQVERGLTKISLDLLSEISTVLNCDVASLISESAINNDNYIETQLVNEIKQLDSKKRKMALDFIGLIKTW